MKAKIHPNYMMATVSCACGNSWQTGATKSTLKVEVCSRCHPYFTGEQRIVDTEGRVERFVKRWQKGRKKAAPKVAVPVAEPAPEPEAKAEEPAPEPEAKL
ncbi:MAG: 50S ribosomal protein L31 [Chloroflexi bacterium]|nr:50S ribosomal protein L31 [Chloroflexota bacterium]